MRCAVYCRLSQDRNGDELGIDRQREDCRELVARRGGAVAEEFCDNDTSATSSRKRPAYERMLTAVSRGEVDAIAAWSLDRLVRRTADLERLVELCDKHSVTILLARGSDLDLSTPSGRLVARLLGAVSRHEVDAKSDRQRREARQRAERGAPPGGRRAFGYETDGRLVETERLALKRAYASLLAGGTLSGIAADLNAEGFTTTMGGPWKHNTVRNMLLNARNAGIRTYRGAVMGAATWQPIVSEDVFHAAVALLTDDGRRTNTRGNALTHLGTNLYQCGRCPDQTVVCTYRGAKAKATQRRVYRCMACYLTRGAEPVDELVRGVVVERLRRDDGLAELIAKPTTDTAPLHVEAKALRARRKAAPRLFAEGVFDEDELRETRERIDSRLAEIQAAFADAGRGSATGALLNADDPGQAWLDLGDVGRRQAVVRELMTIRLLPTGSGRRVFDPASVEILWKGRLPSSTV
jgi:site-specific DNA recombinase